MSSGVFGPSLGVLYCAIRWPLAPQHAFGVNFTFDGHLFVVLTTITLIIIRIILTELFSTQAFVAVLVVPTPIGSTRCPWRRPE
eukprot:4203874-Pyramimonas_sp.AAC.4